MYAHNMLETLLVIDKVLHMYTLAKKLTHSFSKFIELYKKNLASLHLGLRFTCSWSTSNTDVIEA